MPELNRKLETSRNSETSNSSRQLNRSKIVKHPNVDVLLSATLLSLLVEVDSLVSHIPHENMKRYKDRALDLKIEQKIIIVQVDERSHGEVVEIIERNRHRSFTLKIDLGGVFWASQVLQDVGTTSAVGQFFRKYTNSSAIFCLQSYSNRRGEYVELSKWVAGIRRSSIIIPAGVNRQGWKDVAGLLDTILFGTRQKNHVRGTEGKDAGKQMRHLAMANDLNDDVQQNGVNKEVHTEDLSHQVKTGMNRGRSYAEVLKLQSSFSISNDSSLVLQQAVMCERTDFFISWEQIEKVLCKSFKLSIKLRPFQLNRALFFTKTKEMAMFYGDKGLQFFDKGIAVILERWSDEKHRKSNARLKVKGSTSRFLPSTVEISTDEGAITVHVKLLLKAVKRREGHRQWSFQHGFSSELGAGGREDDKVEGTAGTRGCLVPKEVGVHEEDCIF
ncbi:hypothetical protein LOK49_LG09G02293 [Camellia lanceoleosa]|uniref:Uncharacterized protein n=1 Tax=Camellia lanceoleosa TaxID=1840588 RepID=A0ACC0GKB7_9ERIC|nr:hypothetical protein LOK49_LG09G02293 [Camellia lanceoleosa]